MYPFKDQLFVIFYRLFHIGTLPSPHCTNSIPKKREKKKAQNFILEREKISISRRRQRGHFVPESAIKTWPKRKTEKA